MLLRRYYPSNFYPNKAPSNGIKNQRDGGSCGHSQSLDIPTSRHFLKRHCWQRFRLIRMMGQLSFLRHFLYWMFCWMLLLKKP